MCKKEGQPQDLEESGQSSYSAGSGPEWPTDADYYRLIQGIASKAIARIADLEERLVLAKERCERFKESDRKQAEATGKLILAIKTHRDQHADDLCWMDDNKLYEAAGLSPREPTVGDPDAMLANCKRYIAQRCKPGGNWKSYAELEKENEQLKLQLQSALSMAQNGPRC